ncbi:MAG TPA: NAD-dependent epimerase/dehydratase family protein [Terriglobales bacterium]|nr:NAD-dependent epimerase/dehydratase family protein [Terriglobales bacterium]
MHLVIGAAGYAGRHAVAALRESVPVRTAELSDDLAEAMDGVEVVHVAFEVHSPLQSPRGRWPHPLLVWLVGLARAAGVRRLVYLSSTNVFGFSREGRVSERSPVRPEHPYERALLAEEVWLRERERPEVVVLRAAQGFGPDEAVSGRLFHWLVSGRVALPGGGTAPRTFLAGADLGRAFHAAAARGQPGSAYVLGGIVGTWRDLLVAAAATLRVRARRVGRCSYDLAYLGAWSRLVRTRAGRTCWPTPFVVDLIARQQLVEDGWSRRELSWRPRVASFEAGLAELPGWHRETVPEPDAVVWPEVAERRLTS